MRKITPRTGPWRSYSHRKYICCQDFLQNVIFNIKLHGACFSPERSWTCHRAVLNICHSIYQTFLHCTLYIYNCTLSVPCHIHKTWSKEHIKYSSLDQGGSPPHQHSFICLPYSPYILWIIPYSQNILGCQTKYTDSSLFPFYWDGENICLCNVNVLRGEQGHLLLRCDRGSNAVLLNTQIMYFQATWISLLLRFSKFSNGETPNKFF